MNKRELLENACEKLKNDGISRRVTTPRRAFFISDGEGNQCKFHVKQTDKRIGYTQQDIEVILDALMSVVEDALKNGDEVSIYKFGSIKPHRRAARKVKPPGKDEYVLVEGHYVPKFEPGKSLYLAVKLWELSQKAGDN